MEAEMGGAPVMRVLVSGPLGSGKSTVGRRLRELGAEVIEADRVGHAVLEPGAEAFDAVAASWPHAVVDGRIDRAALAAEVFADPAELRRLEAITHPAIAARIHAAVAPSTAPVVAVELPVLHDLLGPGWHRIVVLAADDTRRARAVARGMDEDDVRRRMAAQPSYDVWEAAGDSVIHNDGDLAALQEAVDAWWAAHAG